LQWQHQHHYIPESVIFSPISSNVTLPVKISLVATSFTGVRTEVDSLRIPDVVVCSEDLWSQCCAGAGAGILEFGEVPTLVVEVTNENWREDYIRKRAEYASIDIPEYWIMDPNREHVWILSNPEGLDGYDRVEYTRGQSFNSVQFPQLVLSVDTVLWPPLVENLIREEQARLRQVQERAEQLAAKLMEMGLNPENI